MPSILLSILCNRFVLTYLVFVKFRQSDSAEKETSEKALKCLSGGPQMGRNLTHNLTHNRGDFAI